MRRVSVALVLFLASSARSADPLPEPGARIVRTPEFKKRVDDVVARGVAALKKMQGSSGFPEFWEYPGATAALAYCTLRAAGVPAGDFVARGAGKAIRHAPSSDDDVPT